MYVLGLFKSSFGLFNAYLVVFGLFLPKRKEKKEIPIVKNEEEKYILKIGNVDKGGRGVGRSGDVDNN